MPSVSGELARAIYHVKRAADRQKLHWKRRLGWLEPVSILPYRTYGTPERLTVHGRVVEDRELDKVGANSSPWHNLLHTFRLYHTDEIPDARVRVRFGGLEHEAQCDGDGFFTLELKPTTPLETDGQWHKVEVELIEPKADGQGTVCAVAEVYVPPAGAEFGVISDIDDTVIITGANHMLRKFRTNWLNNADTRRPFPGVDALYTALQHGPDGQGKNPIFYVSSSAWNVYELFISLLDQHAIPRGPLLLRNMGLDRRRGLGFSHKDHKLEQIRPIFETYPDLPFVLVGDSGQKDPEIYRRVTEAYPGRVCAVYIRDVTSPRRDMEVHAIADDLKAHGVPVVLAEDSVEVARHAAEQQLISADAVATIRSDCERDQRRPRGAR